jgi:plastocyanin
VRTLVASPRLALAVLVLALAAAGCGGQAAPPTYPPGAIVITAQDRAFDTAELTIPAGAAFSLVLVNKDTDQHNIAIRTKPGFDGDVVYRHDPIGPSTVILDVGPIPAGTYYFICELHPTMTGTVQAR